jgi:hypothetical protein
MSGSKALFLGVALTLAIIGLLALMGLLWNSDEALAAPLIEERGGTTASEAPEAMSALAPGANAAGAPSTAASIEPPKEPLSATILATDPDAEADTRTSLDSTVLEGMVDPGSGKRLKGAVASWRDWPEVNRTTQTPWWAEVLGRGPENDSGRDLDVTVESDATAVAHFGFARKPQGGVQDSYVYVTSPQHLAALVEVGLEQESIALELKPADPVLIRVVNFGGEPVIGARVQSVGWIGGERERLVKRTYVSDQDGLVNLCPLPNPSVLLATSDGVVSPLWRGEHSAVHGDITLTLSPGFEARGQVTGAPGPEALGGCTILVRLAERNRKDGSLRDEWNEPLATARVGLDGAWSLDSVPWMGAGEYVFRMQGKGITPDEKRIFLETPGNVLVDLSWGSGFGLLLYVRDDKAQPLSNALVSARWKTQEGWMDYHFRSPGDGLVTMDSLPEAEVHVRVSAAGFATQSFCPFNMPAAGNSEGFYLDLARAGHIQGRCVHRGAPVQNFDVTYWGKFSALRVTESFRNAPDGRFVLDTVPIGDVHLLATSDGLAPSETVSADSSSPLARDMAGEDGAVVELELTSPVTGFGRVIDAATGKAVVDALVSPRSSSNTAVLDAWEDPVRTDASGEFRDLPLAPVSAALRVDAPGFSPHNLLIGTVEDSPHNAGVISLERFESVEVQLLSAQEEDFSTFTCTLFGHSPVPFDASGHARFDQVEAGYHMLSIQPENMYRRLDTAITVQPGRTKRVEVVVDFGSPSVIELIPEAGMTLPELLFLNVYLDSELSGSLIRLESFDENLEVETSLPPGRRMIFTVMDHLGTLYVTRWVTTSDTGGERITLELEGESHHLLFVDSKGQPVSEPYVRVGTPPLESVTGWLEMGANTQGRLVLRNITESRILLFATGPGDAVGQIQEVTLGPSSPDEPILVPYECDHPILALASERGQPLDGVRTTLHHSLTGAVLDRSSSDDGGQVPFGPLAAGSYVVKVTSGGFWPDTFTLQAPDPGQQQIFEVRRLGGIRVELVREGQPMPGIGVDFISEERGTRASDWIAAGRASTGPSGLKTAADGSIVLSGVPNGGYSLQCILPSGELFEQIVQIPPLAEGLVIIELP